MVWFYSRCSSFYQYIGAIWGWILPNAPSGGSLEPEYGSTVFAIINKCSWWFHDGVVQNLGSWIYMCVGCKTHPFGNEWHTICFALTSILWRAHIVEGKERPTELGEKKWEELGKTVGLMLRMCELRALRIESNRWRDMIWLSLKGAHLAINCVVVDHQSQRLSITTQHAIYSQQPTHFINSWISIGTLSPFLVSGIRTSSR